MTARPLCRHCQRVPAARPRGLCWTCYYAPGVREQYPTSGSPGAARGVNPGFRVAPPPARPTPAAPGTPEKIAALEQRAAAGE